MKRIASFLLAACLVTTSLCACHTEPDVKETEPTTKIEEEEKEGEEQEKEKTEETEEEMKHEELKYEEYRIGDTIKTDDYTFEVKQIYKCYNETHNAYEIIALITYTNNTAETVKLKPADLFKVYVDNEATEYVSNFSVNQCEYIKEELMFMPYDLSIDANRSATGYVVTYYYWESEEVEVTIDNYTVKANISELPDACILAPTPTPTPEPTPTPTPEPTPEINVDENGIPVEEDITVG